MESEVPSPNPEALLAHAEFVRRLARSLVTDEHRVDDIVQETFLASLRRAPLPGSGLRAWLATVARNAARMVLRADRRRRHHEHAVARSEATPSPVEVLSRTELHRAVVDAVLALEEPYRFTVLLRYFEDLPPRTIARRLDVPVETVRVRLRRALDQLRGRLDRLDGGDRRAWSLALLPLARLRRATYVTGATFMGKKVILVALGAAVAGSAVTLWSVDRKEPAVRGSAPHDSSLRREVAGLRSDLERTRRELKRAEAERAFLAREAARESKERGPDAESRRSRVAQLRAEMDGWFERGDAKAALAALKELVALKTEGWPLAMELWLRIRDDSGRASRLGLGDMAAAAALNDPALYEVMAWSLENPSPAGFREHAAWDLPWHRDLDQTLAQFTRILPNEEDPEVKWALVSGLASMQTEDARKVLLTALQDPQLDPTLRGMVATRLVGLARWITHGRPETGKGAELVRAVQNVAAGDATPCVRMAAEAALKVVGSTVTGFLVTGFREPGGLGEKAGLEVGDIIVSYDGRSISNAQTLNQLVRPWIDSKTVDMVVLRGGEKVRLRLQRGYLGTYGLAVADTRR